MPDYNPNNVSINNTTEYETNYFNNLSSNYSDSLSIEIAKLQRRILLPILPKEVIGHKVLYAYDVLGYDYRIKDQFFTDTVGNFHVSMLMPLLPNDKSRDELHAAPSTSNIINEDANVHTQDYTLNNYMKLVIPKYIVCNFTKEIPKDTEFITCYAGGLSSIANIKIIGVGKVGEYKMKIEEPISTVGMSQEQVIELVRKDIKDLVDEYNRVKAEEEALYGYSFEDDHNSYY